MHLTVPSHWSRSIGTGGRDPSERVVTIVGMRTVTDVLTINRNRSALPSVLGCLLIAANPAAQAARPIE